MAKNKPCKLENYIWDVLKHNNLSYLLQYLQQETAQQTDHPFHKLMIQSGIQGDLHNIIKQRHQEHTSTNKIPTSTIAEVMKYPVSMVLKHLCMNVKTWIAKFRNFLGQQLYPIDRIAEDDWLVYLKLEGEKIILLNLQVDKVSCIKIQMWDQTLEKRVLRQWTFCLSSTNA